MTAAPRCAPSPAANQRRRTAATVRNNTQSSIAASCLPTPPRPSAGTLSTPAWRFTITVVGRPVALLGPARRRQWVSGLVELLRKLRTEDRAAPQHRRNGHRIAQEDESAGAARKPNRETRPITASRARSPSTPAPSEPPRDCHAPRRRGTRGQLQSNGARRGERTRPAGCLRQRLHGRQHERLIDGRGAVHARAARAVHAHPPARARAAAQDDPGKIRRVELRTEEHARHPGDTPAGRAQLELWEQDLPELRT